MAGFGLDSFGLAAFGLGTPNEAPVQPVGSIGSRYINPISGDYEIDGVTGHLKQMPGTRQRVMLALTTLKTSATVVPRFGIRLPRKMGTAFEFEVKQAIRLALMHLTDFEQVIQVDDIIVERGRNSRAMATVVYTDLETDEADQRVTF